MNTGYEKKNNVHVIYKDLPLIYIFPLSSALLFCHCRLIIHVKSNYVGVCIRLKVIMRLEWLLFLRLNNSFELK